MVIKRPDNSFVMVKNMADGSKAVGLFNRGKDAAEMGVDWSELQLSGKQEVRDLWHQNDLGVSEQKFTASVPAQGVVLIRLYKK